jgi:hypothetical protein
LAVLGYSSTKLTIVPDGSATGSHWHPPPLDYDAEDRRDVALGFILVCYAGMHAQRLIDPDAPDRHGNGDERNAFWLSRTYNVMPRSCGQVGDDLHWAYLEKLRRKAGRLVTKHRLTIAKLAEELLRCKTMMESEIDAFIRTLLDKKE